MKILITFLLVCFHVIAHGQFPPIDSISRKKPNAKANGQYDIVATINKIKLNKGDSAIVELYITGYGSIQQAKIFFSTSTSDVFEDSYVIYSLGKTKDNNVYWGSKRDYFDRLPFTMLFNGTISGTLSDSTIAKWDFFKDKSSEINNTLILSEQGIINAPVTVHLKIKKDARPDDYKFNVNFSYFNGSEWASSSASVDFRVNNCIQANEVLFGFIGFLAALIAFAPGIQLVWNKFFQKRKTTTIVKI